MDNFLIVIPGKRGPMPLGAALWSSFHSPTSPSSRAKRLHPPEAYLPLPSCRLVLWEVGPQGSLPSGPEPSCWTYLLKKEPGANLRKKGRGQGTGPEAQGDFSCVFECWFFITV